MMHEVTIMNDNEYNIDNIVVIIKKNVKLKII